MPEIWVSAPHFHAPSDHHFGQVFGLSLGASCRFRFRRAVGDKWERFALIAEPRSLYLMSGESRNAWEHSIPAVEQRRYSITFRTMKAWER
jgi:alkylated DNA repair dioxygenase AlkB